jgi:hypothetical protein
VQLPEVQPGHVDVEGAKLAVQAYVDPKAAESALRFFARGAGLLPVRFVIHNQAHKQVSIAPGQTYLIDGQAQAWPLLTADQVYERSKCTLT